MNAEVLNALKKEMKLQDKLIKIISRIDKLPDTQRKKLEAMNIIGPKYDKKLFDMIKERKEIKKLLEKELKGGKSVYDGLSKNDMVKRMTGQ
ncbi:MAG TPA: hypothetical protein PKJ10_05390 [Smithella sp.]|nr:hypothetical protein [Smithella sp.]